MLTLATILLIAGLMLCAGVTMRGAFVASDNRFEVILWSCTSVAFVGGALLVALLADQAGLF